eukprot:1176938-Prorocentrum_minimum.AAC.1
MAFFVGELSCGTLMSSYDERIKRVLLMMCGAWTSLYGIIVAASAIPEFDNNKVRTSLGGERKRSKASSTIHPLWLAPSPWRMRSSDKRWLTADRLLFGAGASILALIIVPGCRKWLHT